jgi:hypothetical protein
MSLQPQCVRSMRTGVRSRRMGKGAVGRGAQQFGPDAQRLVGGWPTRNIHWLPRTERTLRRTWSARVWKARAW